MVDLEKLKSEFWDGKYKIDCKDEKDKSKKVYTQAAVKLLSLGHLQYVTESQWDTAE